MLPLVLLVVGMALGLPVGRFTPPSLEKRLYWGLFLVPSLLLAAQSVVEAPPSDAYFSFLIAGLLSILPWQILWGVALFLGVRLGNRWRG